MPIESLEDIRLREQAEEKAKLCYSKITSWGNYLEMNGIERVWFIEKIKQAILEFHQERT